MPSKCAAEGRIDDALVTFQTSNQPTAIVEVVDVGEGVQIAVARHLNDDADPGLRECSLILAIA